MKYVVHRDDSHNIVSDGIRRIVRVDVDCSTAGTKTPTVPAGAYQLIVKHCPVANATIVFNNDTNGDSGNAIPMAEGDAYSSFMDLEEVAVTVTTTSSTDTKIILLFIL